MGKTSWQIKEKYNRAHYKKLIIQLDKELVSQWEEKLKQDGIAKAQFLREAINKYLEEK
ncbi:MAG: CopG family transcriptional regulator [Oscillospiraceae bacterium]|jgi:predicted DNA-binding protein